MKLLDASGTDFAGILQHFGVDKARLAGELARSLDKLKTGNARTPAFSPSLVRMLREAWTIGSLDFGAGQVRTGVAILALVSDEELSRLVRDVSKEFRKIEAEALRKELPAIVADSPRGHGGRGRGAGFGSRVRPRRAPRRRAARRRTSISSPSTSPRTRARERSIRCWGAISRSARWSTF